MISGANVRGNHKILRALSVRLSCKWLFWHGDGLPYKNPSARLGTLVRAELAAAERAAEEAGHARVGFSQISLL